jgi:hypothetical protein
MNLREVLVRPVVRHEEQHYQELMDQYHYLGKIPKISETLWYVALWRDQWVALLTFSASALKCKARDQWIGWSPRHQFDRLKLVVNNSRFLILPDWHIPNLGSRVLSLIQKRVPTDWQNTFGHPVVLLETFVDPQRFQGTVYKAANWLYCRQHQRLSPCPPRLQRHAPLSENGFRQTFTTRCAKGALSAFYRIPLSYNRDENHAERRTDAVFAQFFLRHPGSPP